MVSDALTQWTDIRLNTANPIAETREALETDEATYGAANEYAGFFQPIECFERINAGRAGYGYVYCVGNCLILTASFVNTLLVTFILIHHLRIKGAGSCKTYIKVKSLILLLMILFEASVCWRYLVNFRFE